MAGIGYVDKIILYTREGTGEIGSPIFFHGIPMDNVRIELTESKNITKDGTENANKCIFKIYDEDLPGPYFPPEVWRRIPDKDLNFTFDKDNSFFIITEKKDINITFVSAPIGAVNDNTYPDGFKEWLQQEYGYVFDVNTIDHYSLIRHWEIGGK